MLNSTPVENIALPRQRVENFRQCFQNTSRVAKQGRCGQCSPEPHKRSSRFLFGPQTESCSHLSQPKLLKVRIIDYEILIRHPAADGRYNDSRR